ncbi:hypothetical protein HK18_01415 [Commensalibacter intestini]|uniref:Uncharacterized protein n=1 Tax=Commensalibacter intestini TaxID=479936 RepID=A0A251ZT20_9PROT|nr:hypothetical protein [Commensalibacter intestini]OUI77818.1 hypothetical protein HK18_01415 [Commensalibacter intestini]
MAKKRNNDQSKSRIIEFKEEFENLIKKYKIIPNPIIGFDLIAFMSNYSERQISRLAKDDPTFPTLYELSYHNKGCKLSEVEEWIELFNKKTPSNSNTKSIPMTNASQPLQAHQ